MRPIAGDIGFREESSTPKPSIVIKEIVFGHVREKTDDNRVGRHARCNGSCNS